MCWSSWIYRYFLILRKSSHFCFLKMFSAQLFSSHPLDYQLCIYVGCFRIVPQVTEALFNFLILSLFFWLDDFISFFSGPQSLSSTVFNWLLYLLSDLLFYTMHFYIIHSRLFFKFLPVLVFYIYSHIMYLFL